LGGKGKEGGGGRDEPGIGVMHLEEIGGDGGNKRRPQKNNVMGGGEKYRDGKRGTKREKRRGKTVYLSL